MEYFTHLNSGDIDNAKYAIYEIIIGNENNYLNIRDICLDNGIDECNLNRSRALSCYR